MKRELKNLPRLFVDADLSVGSSVTLDPAQSNYLVRVLRLTQGANVRLFNGVEGEWRAQLAGGTKKAAVLEPVELLSAQSPASDLLYCFAPLKTARLDYLIQKAVEMGAGLLQPVLTHHTQVRHLNLDRMLANAVEAAEQCELLSVPSILPPVELDGLVAGWGETHGARALVFADEGEAVASPLPALESLRGRPIGLLVGPEGGFSDAERDLLQKCDWCVPISLGPRILRADTAAVAALAVVQSIIGDWR